MRAIQRWITTAALGMACFATAANAAVIVNVTNYNAAFPTSAAVLADTTTPVASMTAVNANSAGAAETFQVSSSNFTIKKLYIEYSLATASPSSSTLRIRINPVTDTYQNPLVLGTSFLLNTTLTVAAPDTNPHVLELSFTGDDFTLPATSGTNGYYVQLATTAGTAVQWYRGGDGYSGGNGYVGSSAIVSGTTGRDLSLAIVVPEPASAGLLGLGCLSLLAYRRRV